MSANPIHSLAQLDQRYLWHPFTQMRDWLKQEPLVIVRGQGALLQDAQGRKYVDGNSSIWTNLHGHNHPKINAAIQQQLKKIAHSSALGLANEPASLLAAKLVHLANPAALVGKGLRSTRAASGCNHPLTKVFLSDDGSTAMEVALKLGYEFHRRTHPGRRPRFLSLSGAYHGDTVGAVALGHIDLFHKAWSGLLFKTDQVLVPYCYRCPFNRAKPERADARDYRKCNWECIDKLDQRFTARTKSGSPYAGFVFEPLIQGAAGMVPQPAGWLQRAAQIARAHGALLIADEVMTGFGRAGGSKTADGTPGNAHPSSVIKQTKNAASGKVPCDLPVDSLLFACHQENVQPDLMALAKGLTGGYLPMAATLTNQKIFDAFLGEYDEFKTFFHGHSFTANQLGAAAALTNLELLQSPSGKRARSQLEMILHDEVKSLWALPQVGDIRQVGLIVGVELVKDWRTRQAFDLREQVGIRVCRAMAARGVLTRPIGNVIVIMPPYCATRQQVQQIVSALTAGVQSLKA